MNKSKYLKRINNGRIERSYDGGKSWISNIKAELQNSEQHIGDINENTNTDSQIIFYDKDPSEGDKIINGRELLQQTLFGNFEKRLISLADKDNGVEQFKFFFQISYNEFLKQAPELGGKWFIDETVKRIDAFRLAEISKYPIKKARIVLFVNRVIEYLNTILDEINKSKNIEKSEKVENIEKHEKAPPRLLLDIWNGDVSSYKSIMTDLCDRQIFICPSPNIYRMRKQNIRALSCFAYVLYEKCWLNISYSGAEAAKVFFNTFGIEYSPNAAKPFQIAEIDKHLSTHEETFSKIPLNPSPILDKKRIAANL